MRTIKAFIIGSLIFFISSTIFPLVIIAGIKLYWDYTSSRDIHPQDYELMVAVSTSTRFLGKGLTIREAEAKWNWLVPDMLSLTQKTADESKFPPDSVSTVEYIRNYRIKDEIGFVFSWQYQGQNVYLIHQLEVLNGYTQSFALDLGETTIDDFIIGNYFADNNSDILYSFGNLYPEDLPWRTEYLDSDYTPNHLGFMSYSNLEPMLFPGHIASVMWEHLDISSLPYRICDDYLSECTELPETLQHYLDSKLNRNLHSAEKVSQYLTSIKFKYGADGKPAEVLSFTIFDGEVDYLKGENGEYLVTREGEHIWDLVGKVVVDMPLNTPWPGQGSSAFTLEKANFCSLINHSKV